MRLKIRYQQREERKTKSKSISSPCNWHWLRKKQRNMPSSRRLVVTTHRESRDADSESFRTSSICQNGGTWTISTLTMNLFWKETVLLLEAENTQNQDTLKVRNYKQFLPMMSRSDQWPESKYSNLYELWWLKYMYRHNNRKFEIENAHDNLIPQRPTTNILRPRHHSIQWAAGDREHREQVEIRQPDTKLHQSRSLHQLVSVNEFGNQSQQKH